MNCPECNHRMKIKIIPYLYKNQTYLGDFKAEVCSRCNSVYFKEESFKKIEERAKKLGIWGRNIIIPTIKNTASMSKKSISIVNPATIYYSLPSPILRIKNTGGLIVYGQN